MFFSSCAAACCWKSRENSVRLVISHPCVHQQAKGKSDVPHPSVGFTMRVGYVLLKSQGRDLFPRSFVPCPHSELCVIAWSPLFFLEHPGAPVSPQGCIQLLRRMFALLLLESALHSQLTFAAITPGQAVFWVQSQALRCILVLWLVSHTILNTAVFIQV